MTLYIHYCLQSEEMEILTFPVGCAERDWVRSSGYLEIWFLE